jgi:hypothetical protein
VTESGKSGGGGKVREELRNAAMKKGYKNGTKAEDLGRLHEENTECPAVREIGRQESQSLTSLSSSGREIRKG